MNQKIRILLALFALPIALNLGCANARPVILVDADEPSTAAPSNEDTIASELGQVAFDAASAVVHINCIVFEQTTDETTAGKRDVLHSMGTGVLISSRGQVLTNEHVVRNAVDIRVVLDNGTSLPVKRIATDWQFDLALLEIDPPQTRTLLPHTVSPTVGAAVVALGRDEADSPLRIAAGVITHTAASLQEALGPAETRDYNTLLECTAPILHGFSGGPLLDRHGRFVGVNVAIGGRNGIRRSYALPFTPQVRHAIQRMALNMSTLAASEEADGLLATR